MGIFFNAKEVIEAGKIVEINGEKFYNAAAKAAGNSDLICLFEYLAAEEKVHQSIFSEMEEKLAGQSAAPTTAEPDEEALYLKDLAARHVFNKGFGEIEKMIKERAEGTEVVDLVLKFEADSVAFFQQLSKLTPPEWGKSEIEKLIDEEREHVKKLQELKDNMASAG